MKMLSLKARRTGSRIRPWSCLAAVISLVDPVFGYYCDHNLCSATEEYCCGDNLCCDYANSWWYFWVTVLLVLLIISLIWGLIGFFCLESLGQHQNLFSRYLHKLVLRTVKSSRNDSKWFEDPESSLLSRQGSPVSASGDENSASKSGRSGSLMEKSSPYHSGSHHHGRMDK